MMKVAKLLMGIGVTTLVACNVAEYQTQEFAAAINGPWQPPAELVEKSQSYDIPYVGAGPWTGPEGCGGSFLAGTRDFKTWIETYWLQVSNVGGYACRSIRGNPNEMSVHATGRAIDLHIPMDDGEADNDLGDPLANYLIDHAQEIGIQLIIWDGWIFSMGQSGTMRSRAYGGLSPHIDHLHVELTTEAAAQNYPWWQTNMVGPDLGDCGVALGKGGGIVDNEDTCFTPYGAAEFWRTETEGYNGNLRWTNAWQTDRPSNWARWNILLADAGTYRVEYNSTREWAIYSSTRYSVAYDGQETEITIDQSAGEDGWNVIGEFEFAQGGQQWVNVYDDSRIDVESDQHIIADAIRLIRLDLPEVEIGEDDKTKTPDPPDTEERLDDILFGEDSSDEGCSTVTHSEAKITWLWLLIGFFGIVRRRAR